MTLRTERLHRKAAVFGEVATGHAKRGDSSRHRRRQHSGRNSFDDDPHAASSSSASLRRGLSSQVTALGNGTRIALKNGYSGGQQTYVCPIQIQDQQFDLQVDTGSADLWIASTGCHDDPCRNKGGTPPTLLNVNSDGFQAADSDFGLTYLYGSAAGPIYTANVTLGNTTIVKQAFAAANSVSNEDLGTGKFSGILGLSLPALSVEQQTLNKAEQLDNPQNSQSDPSFTGSPLPGLWSDAPAGTRFFGLGLQRRPEEGGVGDSVLTFGAHDPAYAPDPSKIAYRAVVPDTDSIARYWRTIVTEIVVFVGSNFTSSITLAPSTITSATNTGYPSVIFDSGAPISFGPSSVLNSMYGAFGINPAENGWFYLPCATQLNISMTINGAVIPIHPLDASLFAGVDDTDNCLGSFQSLATLTNGAALPADFVIAAPVMRSMYTVFTCDGLTNNAPPGAAGPCRPLVGVLPTVNNRTQAEDQFYKVRVLKQALGSSTDGSSTILDDTRGLSSGVKVLIGCLSALILIVLLFLGLLFVMKRRRKAEERLDAANAAAAAASPTLKAKAGSTMARTNTLGGRRSTGGFVSRRHPSEASASAFASSSRSRSKMHLADDDENYNYSQQEASQDDNAMLAMDPKYRAVAQMHGVYLDEVDDELMGPSPARDLRGPRVIGLDEDGNHLGVGNAGQDVLSAESNATYFEARAIKNEYLRRHPSLQSITPNEGPASSSNRLIQGVNQHDRDAVARRQSGLRAEDIPLDDLPPRHEGNFMRDSTLSAIPAGTAFPVASRTPDQVRLQPLGFSRQYGMAQNAGSPEPLLDRTDLQDRYSRQ